MIDIIKELGNGKCIGRCQCGTVKEFFTSNIRSGKSKSCGCITRKPSIPTEVKRTFNLMRYRCNTKTSPDYSNWGAKGIMVLYKDVFEFYADVGDKPSKEYSIDRINNDGHYEKGNCRWADKETQCNNRGTSKIYSINGKSMGIAQISRLYNIKYSTLKERIKRGWSINDAISIKVDSMRYKAKNT